jgi:hypothetical protein
MLTGSDLNRLSIELNLNDAELDVDDWAAKEKISDHAILTIANCFRLAEEAGVSMGGIALTAFYLGWEAHKQYGQRRYNNDASITGGS